jgi:hypothetical protein
MNTIISLPAQDSILDLPRPDGAITGLSFGSTIAAVRSGLPCVADDGRIGFGAGMRLPNVADRGRIGFGAGMRLPQVADKGRISLGAGMRLPRGK